MFRFARASSFQIVPHRPPRNRAATTKQTQRMVAALNSRIVNMLAAEGGDREELRSDLMQEYWRLEANYTWTHDRGLERWVAQAGAQAWWQPHSALAREAGMRVLGKRALSGKAPIWTEQEYDLFYPIYDSSLELARPIARLEGFNTLDWGVTSSNARNAWLSGECATDWQHYPKKVGDLYIIGERTTLIRPDWERPQEQRYRGILSGIFNHEEEEDSCSSDGPLTYAKYLDGLGQAQHQLIVWNRERQLSGSAYRWIAINAVIARNLGWIVSNLDPFEWHDTSGHLMVKSVLWRDGRTNLKSPHFDAVGEGWVVLAAESAIAAVLQTFPDVLLHLWVRRESHGAHPCDSSWHLSCLLKELL